MVDYPLNNTHNVHMMNTRLYDDKDLMTPQGSDLARRLDPVVKSLIDEAIQSGVSLRDLESVLLSEIGLLICETILMRGFDEEIPSV